MKQKIQWVKSIEEKEYSGSTFFEKVMSVLPATLLSVFCALIFMGAAVFTLTDIYGIEMPSVLWVSGFVFVMFITSAVSELSLIVNTGYSKYISAGVLILGVTGFSSHFWKIERVQNFLGGIVAFLRLYARNWSARYGESVLWYEGNEKYIEDSVYFVLFFLFFVILWIAKQIKNDGFMIWIPFMVIIMQLLVGKTPGRGGVFLFLAGLILSGSMRFRTVDMQPVQWKKRVMESKMQLYTWICSGFLLISIGGGVLLFGARAAEKLTEKYADEVASVAAKGAENIKNSGLWDNTGVSRTFTTMLEKWFLNEDKYYEKLSNDMPVYEQIAVLEADVNQKPLQNIYLKGFSGDRYENGSWVRDKDGVEGMCHEAGLAYEDVNKNIVYLTADRIGEIGRIHNLSENNVMREVGITFLGEPSEEVFAPYYAKAVGEEMKLDGEVFSKKYTTQQVKFTQWNQEAFDFAGTIIEKSEWEKLYEKYVKENYLSVSKEMPVVEETAGFVEMQFLEENTEDQRKELSENEIRLLKAQLTAAWLSENTTYSLVLPALTEGTDPIEYFLGTSKRGYCMHYAGAAVMLLREMDVPSRYASGYLVHSDDFYATETGYKASVLDEQRHAWVEIYLDGIGWIPMEVTKSYPAIENTQALLESLPQEKAVRENKTQTVATEAAILTEETVEIETPEMKSTMKEESDIESMEASENETLSENVNPDEEETLENTEEPAGDEKTTEKTEAALPKPGMPKSVLWAISVCFVLIGIVSILMMNTHKFFKSESVYYKQLKREMKRGRYKQVIILINSGIYRKLQYKKLIQPGDGDESFEYALRTNYTDMSKEEWDRYMAIVKSAAFSEKECTQEEMQYCYEVYRDVIYKDEVW